MRLFSALPMAAACLLACSASAFASPRQVVGYVFQRNALLQPGQIPADAMTRINYAFANIQGGRMTIGDPVDPDNFARLNALKQQNPRLTVLVSVGGWLWSTWFSDVSLTVESRRIFTGSAVEFLEKYNLDGLDIDWEYPGMVGSGHPFRPEDKRNFTLLVEDLHRAFGRAQKRLNRRLYLTIATGASDEYLAHTEMSQVRKYVDTVNLMTYDMVEPASNAITGHHAPLYTNPQADQKLSARDAVEAFLRAGVPARKILLGVPFYGHAWAEVPDVNHGLFQPGKPAPQGYTPYGSLAGALDKQGFVRYWDAAASAPYLYSAEKKIFITYEDRESVTAKCGFVRKRKLGGVMFWAYSSDPTGGLLGTINHELRGMAPPKGETHE